MIYELGKDAQFAMSDGNGDSIDLVAHVRDIAPELSRTMVMVPAGLMMSMATFSPEPFLGGYAVKVPGPPELNLIEEMEIERKRADPVSESAKPNNRHARRAAKARQRRK